MVTPPTVATLEALVEAIRIAQAAVEKTKSDGSGINRRTRVMIMVMEVTLILTLVTLSPTTATGVETSNVLAKMGATPSVLTRIRIGIKSNLCRVKPKLACAIVERQARPVKLCTVTSVSHGGMKRWEDIMPVTMTSGFRRRRSTERLKPHRHSMTRRRMRKKRRKKNRSLLTWNLTHGKRVTCRRITPPQAETNKTMKISLGLGLVLPVIEMRCDPRLRDRGG